MIRALKLITSLVFILASEALMAQDKPVEEEKETDKYSITLEGMIGISAGDDFYSVNVGGPSLFVVFNKKLKVGVGALPSLYILNGNLGARLGVAPRIDYKNYVLFAPFFHRDRTDEWIWSVGMGYKFHKK